MPFIEAMRQFQFRVGTDNFCVILVSLVPEVGSLDKEQKTKPTQHSVKDLRSLGLSPDLIACRSSSPLTKSTKEKISQFCHVDPMNVISVYDVSNLFRVPLLLRDQEVGIYLQKRIKLYDKIIESDLKKWEKLSNTVDEIKDSKEEPIYIVIVGKYTGLSDSYHSISKSLDHASIHLKKKVNYEYINSDHLTDEFKDQEHNKIAWEKVKKANGILIPGGFSVRGLTGKILATEYARVNKIPFLGICLGMQVACIEFARNVLKLKDANSTEFDSNTTNPIVINMPEISKDKMGGTMRLGKRKSFFKVDCKVKELYGNVSMVEERHRHRYEVNLDYIEKFEEKGFMFVAQDETGKRQEIIELKDHPYFVATQYHPEFKSRPFKPSPPFVGLLLASSKK